MIFSMLPADLRDELAVALDYIAGTKSSGTATSGILNKIPFFSDLSTVRLLHSSISPVALRVR
eukprot:SAG11_NODE_9767_length_882_cov_1.106003_2_plen_63_part_00